MIDMYDVYQLVGGVMVLSLAAVPVVCIWQWIKSRRVGR